MTTHQEGLLQDLELGHIFSYAIKENFISETRANQLRLEIMKGLSLRGHIQKMLDKCKIELESIRNDGQIDKKPLLFNNELWYELQEERHEYLEDLQSKLLFMLEHPEVEQTV